MRLIQQILEIRKAESGNLQLKVSEGDIAQFIKNAIEAFQPLIRRQKIHFSIICAQDFVKGYFDSDKLDKIIYNLLSNALKYNNEGGFVHIELNVFPEKTSIQFNIADNGPGLSPE